MPMLMTSMQGLRWGCSGAGWVWGDVRASGHRAKTDHETDPISEKECSADRVARSEVPISCSIFTAVAVTLGGDGIAQAGALFPAVTVLASVERIQFDRAKSLLQL